MSDNRYYYESFTGLVPVKAIGWTHDKWLDIKYVVVKVTGRSSRYEFGKVMNVLPENLVSRKTSVRGGQIMVHKELCDCGDPWCAKVEHMASEQDEFPYDEPVAWGFGER